MPKFIEPDKTQDCLNRLLYLFAERIGVVIHVNGWLNEDIVALNFLRGEGIHYAEINIGDIQCLKDFENLLG